jgi:hypothetical protein
VDERGTALAVSRSRRSTREKDVEAQKALGTTDASHPAFSI